MPITVTLYKNNVAYNGGLHNSLMLQCMHIFMDNTVGSLSQVERSVVLGSLLGDGYLRIINGRKNAFLEINHAYSQKEYVDWKFSKLQRIVISPPKRRKSNEGRVAYRFFTKQHEELTEIHSQFYRNGIKYIPMIELDPIILAVWYMDDGSACRASDLYINTQQFDYSSQLNLIISLSKFGLHARLNRDKQYWRIRFLKSSIPQLKNLVSQHIIPSMRYKLDL